MQRLIEQNTPDSRCERRYGLSYRIDWDPLKFGTLLRLKAQEGFAAFSIRGNFFIKDKLCTERAELLDINRGVKFTEVRSALQVLARSTNICKRR